MDEVFDPYLRKSNNDLRRSVQRQLADLQDGAASAGIRLAERVFVDPDLSASRFARKGRPDYAALVEHVQSGQCDGIALAEASRGSRSLTEWSGFLDLCRSRKVRIWVASHERIYDLSRRQDWRVLADEGVNAADESERLSERVLSGKRNAARQGKPAGKAVFGFTRVYDDTGRLVDVMPHPTQAPIVVELVTRVAGGEPLYTIARDLNNRAVPTPRGARLWRPVAVRQIVLNPSYAGKRVHQGEVIGDAMWQPIVEERLWRKASAVLTNPARRTNIGRGTALVHWLSTAGSCGACGGERLRKGSQGRYACRACQKVTIAQGPYEALVEQAVLSRLAKPDAAAVWARPADTAALAAAEADAADLRAALQEHYQQAAMRRLSAQGLAAVEAGLLPQIERAEARVKALSTPSELATIGDPGQIIERWPSLPPVQKRAVVRALIDLVVDPATVKGGRGVDPRRFDRSRWIGDDETWGQAYERQTAARVGADRIEPPAPVKVPTPRRPRHRQPGGTRA